jgi:hypothetical protein
MWLLLGALWERKKDRNNKESSTDSGESEGKIVGQTS